MTDRAGFEAFYRARLPDIVRACALVMLDPGIAEEIAAEAFARTWAKWNQIHDDDHAGGYVYTTAMRLCTKRRTRRSRELVGLAERSSEDAVAAVVERRMIVDALAGLPLRQRQAIVLRDWVGYETDDVADMLGIDASTVRVHLGRGRATLRQALEVEERNG